MGHAAIFNSLSEDLGGFKEKIAPEAFDSVLNDDVRALFNHQPELVLGRTKSHTLRLSVDGTGLKYEIDLPDTQTGKDIAVLTTRGDVSQSSFGFIVDVDQWEDFEGYSIRTIRKVKRLLDVSPVTFPAYPDTDVAKRAYEQHLSETLSELKQRTDAESIEALQHYKRRATLARARCL